MKNNSNAFFAAANSYHGFTSVFKDIFTQKDFDRIFIIKGGPGTGKSTLMKKVSERYSNRGLTQTRLFCSSDPASLDGIILDDGRVKIALLDGTPPHSFEPAVPAITDVIINTLDGLDEKKLKDKKNEILALNNIKKTAYEKAYKYLKIAGEAKSCINALLFDSGIYNKAELICNSYLCKTLSCKKAKRKTDLFKSSFSKSGYFTLPDNEEINITDLSENGFSGRLIINILLDKLCKKGLVKQVCKSPLEPSDVEFIYLSDMTFKCEYKPYYEEDELPSVSEIIRLNGISKNAITLSTDALKVASEAHFSLEKIYTDAMDFSVNDMLLEKICSMIEMFY